MSGPAAFYERLDDGSFAPTDATTSPWDPKLQHGSPPTALLVWALETEHPQAHMRVARIAADFMGPIPRKPAGIRTRILRPGRRIELSEAVLECDGRDVVVARIWRVGTLEPGSVPATPGVAPVPIPAPDPDRAPVGPDNWGYGQAFDWHFVQGGVLDAQGPAKVWSRPRIPLVAGVTPRNLDGALLVVDSTNGVSSELPFDRWLFVPPSLSIALLRYPASEWTFLDARTTLAGDGAGAAVAVLSDEQGTFGFANQALYIEPRTVTKNA